MHPNLKIIALTGTAVAALAGCGYPDPVGSHFDGPNAEFISAQKAGLDVIGTKLPQLILEVNTNKSGTAAPLSNLTRSTFDQRMLAFFSQNLTEGASTRNVVAGLLQAQGGNPKRIVVVGAGKRDGGGYWEFEEVPVFCLTITDGEFSPIKYTSASTGIALQYVTGVWGTAETRQLLIEAGDNYRCRKQAIPQNDLQEAAANLWANEAAIDAYKDRFNPSQGDKDLTILSKRYEESVVGMNTLAAHNNISNAGGLLWVLEGGITGDIEKLEEYENVLLSLGRRLRNVMRSMGLNKDNPEHVFIGAERILAEVAAGNEDFIDNLGEEEIPDNFWDDKPEELRERKMKVLSAYWESFNQLFPYRAQQLVEPAIRQELNLYVLREKLKQEEAKESQKATAPSAFSETDPLLVENVAAVRESGEAIVNRFWQPSRVVTSSVQQNSSSRLTILGW